MKKVGELRVIGRSPIVLAGDVVEGEICLTWKLGNAEEIALVEKTFKEYTDRGWLAICEGGDKKKQIFVFDAKLEHITLFPLNFGG
ncbi:hypothetical protein MUP37_03290 [Candidatus Bathyarchaeota archaeon]|nr:hypothetical protein [Candidatus Bathyarchaeota archaeon]